MLIRSVDNLSDAQIDQVLARADHHRVTRGTAEEARGQVVALAFFEASLRTRVGFAAAAARLGASTVEVHEPRASAVSMPESIADTLRTLAGYADVVVTRTAGPLVDLPDGVAVPVLSGGDRGPTAEHPSQALIDLFAMRRAGRPLDTLVVAMCGDLRMRAARSLLAVLARQPPRRLVLVTEPELSAGFSVPAQLAPIVEYGALDDASDADVLYVVGIPHGALAEDGRSRLRVTERLLDAMAPHAVVLSPGPVIDEIEKASVNHPRVQMFGQSDDALFVRMAILELLIGLLPSRDPATPQPKDST